MPHASQNLRLNKEALLGFPCHQPDWVRPRQMPPGRDRRANTPQRRLVIPSVEPKIKQLCPTSEIGQARQHAPPFRTQATYIARLVRLFARTDLAWSRAAQPLNLRKENRMTPKLYRGQRLTSDAHSFHGRLYDVARQFSARAPRKNATSHPDQSHGCGACRLRADAAAERWRKSG